MAIQSAELFSADLVALVTHYNDDPVDANWQPLIDAVTARDDAIRAEERLLPSYPAMLKACEDSDLALCESVGFDELPPSLRAAIIRQRHLDAVLAAIRARAQPAERAKETGDANWLEQRARAAEKEFKSWPQWKQDAYRLAMKP